MKNNNRQNRNQLQYRVLPRFSAVASFTTVFALVVMMAWGGFSSSTAFAAQPAGNGNGGGASSSASPSPTPSPTASPTPTATSTTVPSSGAASISSVTFKAAEPTSYNHSTGGGAWGAGGTSQIVASLQGGNFYCGDVVTFFSRLEVPSTPGQTPPLTAKVTVTFGLDATGTSGVALVPLTSLGHVKTQSPASDSAVSAGNTATVTNTHLPSPSAAKFTSGATQALEVTVGNLTADTTTILRTDAQIECQSGAKATGNLQTVLTSVAITSPGAETISSGAQTISLQKVGDVTVAPVASMSLVMSQISAAPGKAGDTVQYSISASNTGNVPLTAVTLHDDQADHLSCASTFELLVGGTVNCSASHVLTQADVDAGEYSNSARADATWSGGSLSLGSNTVLTSITQTKKLTVTMSDSLNSVAGVILYSIIVQNDGNVTLSQVTLTDAAAVVADCPAISLAPGESFTCSAEHAVSQGDLDAESYDNTASATGTAPGGSAVSDTTSTTTTFLVVKSISVAMTGDYNAATTSIGYNITVSNDGTVTLGNVTLTDARAILDSCPSRSLAPGASFVCTAHHPVVAADIAAESYGNTVSVSGRPPTGAAVTDTDSVTTEIPNPVIAIVLLVEDPELLRTVGDSITYKIVVTNEGNVTLDDVVVADGSAILGLCAEVDGFLPDASFVCTASHTVTQADVDAGSYFNSASVTSKISVAHATSGQVETTFTADPQISLYSGSATSNANNHPGHVVTYTVTAKNTGNVTLTNAKIVDENGTTTLCTFNDETGSFTPGTELTCDVQHTLTVADTDKGSHSYTPIARADKAIDSAKVITLTIPTAPDLDVTVTPAPGTKLTKEGDPIKMDVKVTNPGNVTMKNIEVTDIQGTILTKKGGGACAVSELAPWDATSNASGVLECEGTHLLTQDDVDKGTHTNTIEATGWTGNAGGDKKSTAAFELSVGSDSLMSVVKEQISSNPTLAGEMVTYRVTIFNTGTRTLKNVRGFDLDTNLNSDGCFRATLPVGKSFTCTGSHIITLADVEAGLFSTSAYATADDIGRVISNRLSTGFLEANRTLVLSVNAAQRLTTQAAQLSASTTLAGGAISYFVRSSSANCSIIGATVIARNAGNCVIGSRISKFLNRSEVESNDVSITFAASVVSSPVVTQPVIAPAAATPAVAKQLILPTTQSAFPAVAATDMSSAKLIKAADAAAQSLSGFAPGEQTRVEVIGARTTGQFLLSGNAATDPAILASTLQESTKRNAQSFAAVSGVEVTATPDKSNIVSGGITDEAVKTFAAAKLESPLLVGNLPTDANTKWLKIEAVIDTFKPGSVAYAVVTTQPIILGAAVVDEFGKANITGYLPVSVLPEGGHNIRIVGARSLGGVTTDANGNITLTQNTVNEINKFDQGTNATVLVTGKGANGAMNTATLVVELEKNVPWFTLWYIIGSFLAVMLLAAMRLMRRVRARVVFSVGIALSATPALVLGWITSSYEVMGWGALIALISVGLTWFISPLFTLRQDRAAREARREARRVAEESQYETEVEETFDDTLVENDHRLAG